MIIDQQGSTLAEGVIDMPSFVYGDPSPASQNPIKETIIIGGSPSNTISITATADQTEH